LQFKSGRFAFYHKLKEGLFKLLVASFIRHLKVDCIHGFYVLDDKTSVILCDKPFIITEQRKKLYFANFGYQAITSVVQLHDKYIAVVKDTLSTISVE